MLRATFTTTSLWSLHLKTELHRRRIGHYSLRCLSPTGIAIDPSNGDLYIDNEGRPSNATPSTAHGKSSPPKSSPPNSRMLRESPSILPTTSMSTKAARFSSSTPSGEALSVPLGAGILNGSAGVAVDSADRVYAGNPSRSNLAQFSSSEPSPNPRTDNPAVADSVSDPEAATPPTSSHSFGRLRRLHRDPAADRVRQRRLHRRSSATTRPGQLDCVSCNPTGPQATGERRPRRRRPQPHR